MKQLLAKEVMYEPMKQINEKFPEWLSENEEQLPKEDYERWGGGGMEGSGGCRRQEE